jgi:hypothetical protein
MAHAFPSIDVSGEIAATIKEILKHRLSRFGFARAKIRAGEDHAGDPAIFIDAHYRLSKTPVDADVTIAARSEIRRELLARGEDRFPYLRNHFAKGQPIGGVRQWRR